MFVFPECSTGILHYFLNDTNLARKLKIPRKLQITVTCIPKYLTSGTVKSLHVDVKGDPRKSKVKIPRSIQGYKPSTEPNERFLAQEEPVRRGVKTSSVLAASKRKHISELRGFQISELRGSG